MIKAIGSIPFHPPFLLGEQCEYLTALGAHENLLPYPAGIAAGDLMLGYLPWSCQSGFYGDLFTKIDFATNSEFQYRYLDGSEGTIPQNGIALRGLAGAEYGRPKTDIMGGVALRGMDVDNLPVTVDCNTPVVTGSGENITTTVTTPSFILDAPAFVLCIVFFRLDNWDSGDPNYYPYTANVEWGSQTVLDLITRNICPWDNGQVGAMISGKFFPLGATVPDIVTSLTSNRGLFDLNSVSATGVVQHIACFKQGLTINGVVSGSNILLSGDRPFQGDVIVESDPSATIGTINYPTDYTWECAVTDVVLTDNYSFSASSRSNVASTPYPFKFIINASGIPKDLFNKDGGITTLYDKNGTAL